MCSSWVEKLKLTVKKKQIPFPFRAQQSELVDMAMADSC